MNKETVHPRACGERAIILVDGAHTLGSSPRLRGTGALPFAQRGICRFIPAPAGNGVAKLLNAKEPAVHPRACGERFMTKFSEQVEDGSSPRLRGTVLAPALVGLAGRFIPAPAGNGPRRSCRGRNGPVHPRACGERMRADDDVLTIGGSSPRLRGTGRQLRWSQDSPRFIPAPAGNGSTTATATSRRTVHPRACGERALGAVGNQFINGSSPRLRGTGNAVPNMRMYWRFIPAPAGNGR